MYSMKMTVIREFALAAYTDIFFIVTVIGDGTWRLIVRHVP